MQTNQHNYERIGYNWLVSQNKQQIQPPFMKSELERILNSDLSDYKIAVSDHIKNLDHFEECLTERSMLMQKLNQVLMQQIERCQQDPPSEFDAIELPQQQKQPKLNISNCMQLPFSRQSFTMSQVLKTQRKTDGLMEICSKFQVDIRLMRRLMEEIKRSICHKIEETRKILVRDMASNISHIVEKTKQHYETRIRHLEFTIDELHKQNEGMKNKQKQWVEKFTQMEREQSICSYSNEQLSSNRKQNYQEYSPIQSYARVNMGQRALDQHTQLLTQRGMVSNSVPQNRFKQVDINLTQMTLKNNNEVGWKHFVCDIENTTLKEIKQIQKTKKGKQNMITEIGPTSSVFFNLNQSESHKVVNEPGFPVLLRKTFADKAYDIPIIRALLVSYPPIDEGFSTLKLGNEIVYRGMWKYRKFHGKGKLCLPQYSYEGDFERGLFHGRGTLKIGSMEYVGQFIQNRVEGEGTLRIGSKNISGRWKNNSLMEKY